MRDTEEKQPNYATRTYVIEPGETVQAVRASDFMICLAASAAFKLSLDNEPESDFDVGLTITPPGGFTRLLMRNETGSNITVELGLGTGNVRDARLALPSNVALRTIAAALDVGSTPVAISAPDGAITPVLAADGNRKFATVANDGAGKVYVGYDAAAVAGQGIPLAAGAALETRYSGAIYVRNDSGAAVNICTSTEGVA